MDLITPREIATSENLARDQNLKNAIPTLKDSRKHHENTKITSSVVNCRWKLGLNLSFHDVSYLCAKCKQQFSLNLHRKGP